MKLHELLAIDASQTGQSARVRGDLATTFDKKRHLFEQKIKVFTPNTEDGKPVTEEESKLQSTVAAELKWLCPHIAKALDLEYRISEANMHARADIELPDGTKLATGVPATALLELAKRINEIAQLAQQIPTLDPAKGFELDKDSGEGVYKARIVRKNRTSKEQRPLILYDATEKHPAQVQLITQDVITGTIEEQEWSGLMTPADKAAILERIEILSRAVRAARSRANEQEVDKAAAIGDKLLGYIFG